MTSMSATPRVFSERYGKLVSETSRSFDIEFWQSRTDAARYAAAWEMVVLAQEMKGRPREDLQLQRSRESYHLRDLIET